MAAPHGRHIHVHITEHVHITKTTEVKEFAHSPAVKYLGELVGTFFLVLTIGCNVLTGSAGAAISIGAILVVMIYAIGPVSGGHFNPAVTLAVLLSRRGKIASHTALVYVIAQLAGGILAGAVYVLICGGSFTLAPVGKFHWMVAAIAEILYTAALCYVVLNVATVPAVKEGNQYFGISIGFTVMAAAMAIGGISGCSLNPAVTLGAMMSSAFQMGRSAWHFFPLYFFCPLLGAVLGCGLFQVVNPKEFAA